jgi:hypothetical protein
VSQSRHCVTPRIERTLCLCPSGMPYTQADLDWAAVALNEDATDFDVALLEELEWPGNRSEYEAWLDQIAPTREELEARDRFDAFLGHDD